MKTRKGNILYRDFTDKWGTHKLYYINFDKLIKHWPRKQKLYINDDDVLCTSNDRPLNETIQAHYQEWVEEEIERVLLGK